jgi:hypothetical protein
MRAPRPSSFAAAALFACGALAGAGEARAEDEIDPGFFAPDEPPPLSDEPPPFDARPEPAEAGPRRRRKPREPYAGDEVSPFARNELALAGTVVTGGAWFTGIFVLAPQGFPNNGWPMLIPVAGPWITLGIREDVPGVTNEDAKRGFIAASGVIQGAGLAMFVVGQFLPVTDPMHAGGDYLQGGALRRTPPPRRFAVAPSGSGLHAWGTF